MQWIQLIGYLSIKPATEPSLLVVCLVIPSTVCIYKPQQTYLSATILSNY